MRMVYWVAAITIVVDQLSKYYVVHVLELDRRLAIDVWPPLFNLRMAWNTGINFGLFSGDSTYARWVLIAVALVITGAVLFWMSRTRPGRWHKLAAGLVVGGAVGNIIDRLSYGAVADFINMSCCGIYNPFAFNVADVAVFAGIIGLILLPDAKKHS